MKVNQVYDQWTSKKRDSTTLALCLLAALYCAVLKPNSWLKSLLPTESTFDQLIVQGLYAKTREENPRLPMMLDHATRLDRVDSHGMEYIYHLSVLGQAGERFMDDAKAGRLPAKHQAAKWSICENADIAPLLQAGVTLTYQYSVQGAQDIVAMSLDKNDCV